MAIRKPTEWTLEEARRHLHAVIREASEAGPQPVEHDDAGEALVVPIRQWTTRPDPMTGTLVEFFQRSGLGDVDLDFERAPDTVDDLNRWMERRGTFEDLERLADALLRQAEEPS